MKGSGFFSDCKMEPVKKPMIKLFLNQQKHQEFVGLTTGGEPWRFSSKKNNACISHLNQHYFTDSQALKQVEIKRSAKNGNMHAIL